jgi:hypothetical protein
MRKRKRRRGEGRRGVRRNALHRNGAGWSSGTTTAGMIDQNKKVK